MSLECLNDLLSELGEEENMNIEGGSSTFTWPVGPPRPPSGTFAC